MNIESKNLHKFIEKILNEKMSESEVKQEMEALGLVYTQDPLARLNQLLQLLHPQKTSPNEEKVSEPKI